MMTLVLNLSVLVLSIVIVCIAQSTYMGYLSDIAGFKLSATPTTAIIVGVVLAAVIIAFNFFIIYRKIRDISQRG